MGLKFSLGAGKLSGNPRIALAGEVDRLGESLEEGFDDVMRFVTVKQLQMEITAGFIGEGLEEFARQPEPERARHVLDSFRLADGFVREGIESTPHQAGPAAEVDDAPRQALVHRDEGLGGKRVLRMKTRAITANSPLFAQRLDERLSQRQAAILDRVMRVHFAIAVATQLQIHNGVLRKQREHMIEKGYPRSD